MFSCEKNSTIPENRHEFFTTVRKDANFFPQTKFLEWWKKSFVWKKNEVLNGKGKKF